MTNINQTIWKLIAQDVSIDKALRRDLVNMRALAVYLIKKHHLSASVDAVISAIRRYPMEGVIADQETKLLSIFKNSVVFTKSNMVCMTLEADAVKDLVANFGQQGVKKNFRIIRGKKYTKVIINDVDLDAFMKYFKKADIVDVRKGLGEVRIVLQKGAENMRGIIAKVTGEIALQEISIIEMIFCFPELLVYVDQKDLLHAHQAVLNVQEGH